VASMATRECLSSAARNQARVLSEPSVASPRGSKPLNGMVAPGMSIRLALNAVVPLFTFWTGANALTAPARAIRVAATFILTMILLLAEVLTLFYCYDGVSANKMKDNKQQHGPDRKSKEQQLDPRRLPIAKIDLPASTSYLRRISYSMVRTERYRMTCSGFVFGGKDL